MKILIYEERQRKYEVNLQINEIEKRTMHNNANAMLHLLF